MDEKTGRVMLRKQFGDVEAASYKEIVKTQIVIFQSFRVESQRKCLLLCLKFYTFSLSLII